MPATRSALLCLALYTPAGAFAQTLVAHPNLAEADFDGDGLLDVAVGLPEAGATRSCVGDGRVEVWQAFSFADWTRLSPADASWALGSGLSGEPSCDDLVGKAVVAADFDRDGYDDLAIGAPGEDGEQGAVHVLFGGPTGLDADTEIVLGAERATGAPRVSGVGLAALDLDGDGRVDLAVGAVDVSDPEAAEVVAIVWSSSSAGFTLRGAVSRGAHAGLDPLFDLLGPLEILFTPDPICSVCSIVTKGRGGDTTPPPAPPPSCDPCCSGDASYGCCCSG